MQWLPPAEGVTEDECCRTERVCQHARIAQPASRRSLNYAPLAGG
jgi:hypothetical protein